ncbi:MAG: phage tail assembly chaperone [Silicimonas sp.]|nr:phage tail assembly chaperone [Silicimonas sp.]
MTGFDWGALMRAALARGTPPRAFWALTPAELAFLLGRTGGAGALTRTRLEELAAAYPDKASEDRDDG